MFYFLLLSSGLASSFFPASVVEAPAVDGGSGVSADGSSSARELTSLLSTLAKRKTKKVVKNQLRRPR